MRVQLTALFWLTIRDPAEAALVLVGNPVPRNVGWMILALGIVLNAIVYGVSITLVAPVGEVPIAIFLSPFFIAAFLASVLITLILLFFWAGRSMGGRGRFDDLLLAFGWLQFMRLALQLAYVVLLLASPVMANLFIYAVSLYSIWVVLNFINVVHEFGSLGKSVVLMVLTMLGLAVGMTILLSLMTATAIGMS